MPPWGPVTRRQLVRALKDLGFHGPFPGGKHEYMSRDNVTIAIPNPHRGDIGFPLLSRMLREAGVSRREWESV
jgi:predicted RNA binding protein YcfA (HicA-like mRNA interferase family)